MSTRDRILPLSVVAAVALACAPSRPYDPDDWSLCGAVALGDIESGERSWLDGSQLREAEAALLYALTQHSKLDTHKACGALAGTQIYTRSTACWTDPYGRAVCGLSWCNYRYTEVGTPAHWQHWRTSTLAHELVHVIQGCETPGEIDPGMDRAHANWNRLGISDALQALETLP